MLSSVIEHNCPFCKVGKIKIEQTPQFYISTKHKHGSRTPYRRSAEYFMLDDTCKRCGHPMWAIRKYLINKGIFSSRELKYKE